MLYTSYYKHKAFIGTIMAISLQEALKQAQPSPEELQALEAKIDKSLVQGLKDGEDSITFAANLLGSTAVVREALIQRYKNAGWNVQYHSDQRDGDYYSFSRGGSDTSDFRNLSWSGRRDYRDFEECMGS